MKVKNLIERLKRFDQNKEIVFYNDQLENMWECDIENDSSNNDDVVITIYNEENNDQLKFLLLSHGFIFNDSINNNNMNKQLQKPDLSIRELTKILFNTLRDENKLAIKMIVREYQEKQLNKRELWIITCKEQYNK